MYFNHNDEGDYETRLSILRLDELNVHLQILWREFRLTMINHAIPFLLTIIVHIIKLLSLMITFSTNSHVMILFYAWTHMSL